MPGPNTIQIKDQVYSLPAWNAGQMRRRVEPLLKKTQEILADAQVIQSAGETGPTQLLDLTLRQRQIANEQAELLLAALQNQYPHLTLDDVETLTPGRIARAFHDLVFLSTSGGDALGELNPPSL